ncbi:MAG TPA: hypothetical protein GXX53_08245 [Tissierellia bacterium]|nr:hypothetical protein [Tissierellia bacterium]
MAIILIAATALTACAAKDNTSLEDQKLKEKDEEIARLQEEKEQLENKIEELNKNKSNLLSRTIDVIELLKEKDMEGLSEYVHPTKGLRFSPYAFVDVKTDQVFTKEEVAKLGEDTEVYTWGNFDGSGDPIKMNFNDYYNRFVYDKDFANPHIIGNNTEVGKGNTINNIHDVYTEGHFIEFHFTGFEDQYEGLDWRSLILVFEQHEGQWYLVGIVHNEWTI